MFRLLKRAIFYINQVFNRLLDRKKYELDGDVAKRMGYKDFPFV